MAYKEILIRPEPVGNVTDAKASYHSPYGPIIVKWERTENEFDLQAEIPGNTTAIIYLPAGKTSIVNRDGKKISSGYENGRAIVKVGSGKYNFTVND